LKCFVVRWDLWGNFNFGPYT